MTGAGPIGLRLAVEHPDRIARIVAMDTGLFTGEQRMSQAWQAFRAFVERTEDLAISMLVRGATARTSERVALLAGGRRRGARPADRRLARLHTVTVRPG
jgi:pimeloyl-ACP methyl ester carboxylesterase